jgi:hypothetical protein
MTSAAIRSEITAQWPALVPSLPLLDTHNFDPSAIDKLPPEWAHVGYSGADERIVSLGCTPVQYRETGSIVMRVYVKSGQRDIRALQLVEEVKAAWLHYVGLSGYFQILSISPPFDLADGESSGDWFAVQVAASYFYDTYK